MEYNAVEKYMARDTIKNNRRKIIILSILIISMLALRVSMFLEDPSYNLYNIKDILYILLFFFQLWDIIRLTRENHEYKKILK